ncbi:MAG: DUF488 domain-containing protein [Acidimicrobiales bacterium]
MGLSRARCLLPSRRATARSDGAVSRKFAEDGAGGHHRLVRGRIYSVGYEGLPVNGLIGHLKSARVGVLVDVRLNPMSRKPGYSRKALSAELEQSGISYVHEKGLGNPPENRDSFRRGDVEAGRRRMREILSNGSGPALQRLIDHAQAGRVAVLCVEREECRCHRLVITEMAKELDPSLEVWPIL